MKIRKLVGALLVGALLAGITGTAMAETPSTVPGAVYGRPPFTPPGPPATKPPAKIQEDLQKAGIKDVKADDWFASSITVMVEAGLLQPDANGSIKPDAPVSINEGVAVFAKVLGIASKTDTPEQAAQKAKDAGLISGTSADRDMTRVEVARMLAKALGVTPKTILFRSDYPFNDYASTSADDQGILAALYELGVFKGFEDRTFRPDAVLTKAQIAILVDRILGAYAK